MNLLHRTLLIVGIVSLCGPGFANEAVAEPDQTMDIIGIVIKGIVAVVVAFIGWKVKLNEEEKAALKDIASGVDSAYINYVRDAKREGRFDPRIARDHAIKFAKEQGGAALKLIKRKGIAWATAKVHEIANQKSGKVGKAAKLISSALPKAK